MSAQKGIGRLIQVGVARETTRGTAESAATFWIPWSDLSVDEKNEKIEENQSLGVIEDSNNQLVVKEWAEGQLKAPVTDQTFPLFLYSILGSLSTADDADTDPTIKDHTITVAQSAQHPALTLFLDDPLANQDYKYKTCVVKSLEINYERGKIIEYAANLLSQKGTTATLTPSTTAENIFLPQHVTFKIASDLSGLGAASAVSLKSLNLKIDQNIETDDVLGSTAPADFLNKQMTIEGTFELLWDSETYRTLNIAGTAKAMRIDLVHTATIGSSAHPQIRIDLAKVIFKELTRKISANDFVMQTVSFKAHYSASDSKAITCLAVNAKSSY